MFINKLITGFILAVLIIISQGLQAFAHDIHHRLHIELIPEKQKLRGTDHIGIKKHDGRNLLFRLSERAEINSVSVDGQNVSYRFSGQMLHVPVKVEGGKSIDVRIEYEAIFDDPVPQMPVNIDNPGFGVTGVIWDKGCFLLDGSGWRPVMPNTEPSILLTVKAPKNMIAVTAGERLGETNDGNHTISRWEIKHPVKGLSLSAGYFQVFQKQAENVVVYAFFYPDNAHLADDYLNASVKYIANYESLFGPYPFPKFAIVENFFPTGYGFPSYTLIGSRVLRLPFIIDTSLGHEIAHCWWGNGVYPDYSRGNWSEGLTTYVAEHLYQEQKSEEDARNYRLQMLRNYATLIDASNDFPLAEFTSRVNPATKVIGYDKGAMFFHMLRKQVGDKVFWDALREVFYRHLFEQASWNDFRNVFESLSGKNLEMFFDQWIKREGAPELVLETVDVQYIPSSNGFHVSGKLVQKPPFYHLKVLMVLETDMEKISKTVFLDGESTSFEFYMEEAVPEKLSADPDIDIFRKLHTSEIPPTINSLKASESMLVILGDIADNISVEFVRLLMQGLGIKNYQLVFEKDVHKEKIENHDLLWIGLPSSKNLISFLPENIVFEKEGFFLDDIKYFSGDTVFFGVFPHPGSASRVAGLFVPFSARNPMATARRIPHYGKYSYLVFEQELNVNKGTWSIKYSPLVFHFNHVKKQHQKK